jgi:hypothetical protein
MLGIHVAEYVHGIREKADAARDASDKILSTLQEILSGELTLIDTPEETIAKAPPGMPESFKQRLPEMLNESRRNEREMAGLILRSIYGDT